MDGTAVGMMWYDGDTTVNLETKIQRAAKFYRTKYARDVHYCYIHPNMDEQFQSDEIMIRQTILVLPNHLFVGEEPLFTERMLTNGANKDQTEEGDPESAEK